MNTSRKLNKLTYISINEQNKLKNETYYNNSLKELNVKIKKKWII